MSIDNPTGERGRWTLHPVTKEWIPYEEKAPVQVAYVITDEIDETLCHADDRVYTSKKRMARAIRRSGSIELGPNDEFPTFKRKEHFSTEEELHEAALEVQNKLRWGDWQLTEAEKEEAKRINERWEKKE